MDHVHDLIMQRWSPVAFDATPLQQKEIDLLFTAASWAPSARNGQPWRFIHAVKGTPEYQDFLSLMDDGNRVWASTAPLLVLSLAQVVSTYKNRPNRLAFYETGMAVSNLLLQATAMGLLVHQMSGYNVEAAKEYLVIPTRYEPAAMMAIGRKGDRAQLDPEVASWEDRTRDRKPLEEFVIGGRCK